MIIFSMAGLPASKGCQRSSTNQVIFVSGRNILIAAAQGRA
jgi:hypothetical protein